MLADAANRMFGLSRLRAMTELYGWHRICLGIAKISVLAALWITLSFAGSGGGKWLTVTGTDVKLAHLLGDH